MLQTMSNDFCHFQHRTVKETKDPQKRLTDLPANVDPLCFYEYTRPAACIITYPLFYPLPSLR